MPDGMVEYFKQHLEEIIKMGPKCPYVVCDEDCHALSEPVTLEDYELALEHWKKHRVEGGCSHGC